MEYRLLGDTGVRVSAPGQPCKRFRSQAMF